jgi:hypothetical protein
LQLKKKNKSKEKRKDREKESGKGRSSKDKLKPTKGRASLAEDRKNRTCKVPKYPTFHQSKVSIRFKLQIETFPSLKTCSIDTCG